MKLSAWAKQKGITYKTAHRMFQTGKLPVRSEQLPTGTILVYPEQPDTPQGVALYARVSSADQKEELTRQLHRLRDYAASQGMHVLEEVQEIGSGLNGPRKNVHKLLRNASISVILVEHRDRLARFGVLLVESALEAAGRKIVVLNESEYKADLGQDFVAVVTSLCARMYGKRSAKTKAQKALEAIRDDDSTRL